MARFLKSLAATTPSPPDELIVVDASPDEVTEQVVRQALQKQGLAGHTKYVRVSEAQRGLTRQRNLGIGLIEKDLAAFFDDDIVLHPETLHSLEKILRGAPEVTCAACHIENEIFPTLPFRWQVRKCLGMWSSSEIGFLNRAGMAIPQALLPRFEGTYVADIVPGGATCWRTWVLRSTPFDESFVGYGQAEDVEYSLSTKPLGPKVIVGNARVLHLHDPAGRLSSYQYGRQSGRGFALIFHRYGNVNPTALPRFAAWQLLDLLMLMVSGVRHPRNYLQAMGRLVGLLKQLQENN